MSLEGGWTRRELLGASLAAACPTALAGRVLAQGPVPTRIRSAPKNIIFMVSDGMSMGVPSLAEPFSKLARNRGTHWYELLQHPQAHHGLFEMHSLSSLVTDSAAASSAWAAGTRVFNGAINVLPDGTQLTPIASLLRGVRRRVGLVTTTMTAHATPAGFAAVQPSRDDMDDIAAQYLDLVDVVLGGGRKHFDPTLRRDRRDLLGEFAGRGYNVCTSRSDLRKATGRHKVLGLFGKGHLPYTIDQRSDPALTETVPTLAEMTQAALDALSPAAEGFLLQVEGGRVDHAAHKNDAAAMLWDQLAFDDAIGVVMRFCTGRDDTLVLITSDHGNANPGLNGIGSRYRGSDDCFANLARATASYSVIRRRIQTRLGDGQDAESAVIEALRDVTGVEALQTEARAVARALNGNTEGELNRGHRNFWGVLGQVLGNYTGIGWTGVSHTADLVISTAFGPGGEQFAGLLRNTDVYDRLTALADIRHQNPALTPQAAHKYLGAAPTRIKVEQAL